MDKVIIKLGSEGKGQPLAVPTQVCKRGWSKALKARRVAGFRASRLMSAGGALQGLNL